MKQYPNFKIAISNAIEDMRMYGAIVHPSHWQGVDVSKKPEAEMRELLFYDFQVPIGGVHLERLQNDIKPNLPWADDHFMERIGGQPLNPGIQWQHWPWSNAANSHRDVVTGPELPAQDWAYLAGMIDGEGTIYFRDKERWQGVIRVYQKDRSVCDYLLGIFKVGKVADNGEDVTTELKGETVANPMHFWQVNAVLEVRWLLTNVIPYLRIKRDKAEAALTLINEAVATPTTSGSKPKSVWGREWEPRFNHTYMSRYWPRGDNGSPHIGLRYNYGDLSDVVRMLKRDPLTRQAYLPIFFPEDLSHDDRKPCSLGYHFLMRNDRLNVSYYIRSCDMTRHFRDDIYLTVRLLIWVLEQCEWPNVIPGVFRMDIGSLHMFKNDYAKEFGR